MLPMDEVKVHFVRTVDDLQDFLAWLSQERSWLAVDTETTGLRWWDGRVRLAQVGDCDTAWCFDWEWWAGAVQQGLCQYTGPIAFHNANFDLHFLDTMGMALPSWSQVHDTQIMTSLLDGGAPSGLKPAAARRVDSRVQRGESLLKDGFAQNGWGWDTVPVDFPPYWGYGGLDTILTARLAANEYPEIQAGFKDLYEMERAVGMVLFNMEKRGANVDLPYVRTKRDQLQQEKEALRAWCKTTHDFGPSSPASVRDKLLGLGAELTVETDTGALATTSVVLKELALLHAGQPIQLVCDSVLRYRKVAKTLSSYMDKFLELADVDGHLHPNIRQMGAKTGRMSVATPNLQALTRGPEVRDAFIPAKEGSSLLLVDYDQIEMRLLYHFCRDPGLYTAIMSGDLHTATARMAYDDPTIQPSDPRRQPAKSSGFAKIYGAGIPVFAATAGISEKEARDFMAKYDEAFPGVDPFIGKVQATARRRLRDDGAAWVKTPAGRRQVADPAKIFASVNYLVQGTAADVLKQTLVRLDAAGLGEYMILPVHDEVVFDVPEDVLADVRKSVMEIMPVDAEHFGVPLTVGEDVVARWGDKYRQPGEIQRDDPMEPKDMGAL